MSDRSPHHVSADRLQALLDGAVPERERAGLEEHLAACRRCSEELESWRTLFEDLATLPRLDPGAAFRGRVLASLVPPAAPTLRERLLGLLPSPRPEHPMGDRLQDYVDGALPARQLARVESHLAACGACADEVRVWRTIYGRIGRLEAFAPGEGFRDRVLGAVRLPAHAPVPSAAPARTRVGLRLPDWRRALAVMARFVPKTRRAWAALSGVALTPAVTVGLVLYTVFSHPTLTPQALASFVVWKASELLSVAGGALGALALDAGRAVGVDAIVSALFEAPFALAGGALAYSVVSVLALRVLYKNLLAGRRYARVSHS